MNARTADRQARFISARLIDKWIDGGTIGGEGGVSDADEERLAAAMARLRDRLDGGAEPPAFWCAADRGLNDR